MSGTLIWFSGHTCGRVMLRRSTGLEPDAGFVEIALRDFPSSDAFSPPAPGFVNVPPALPSPPPVDALSENSPAQHGTFVAEPFGHQGILYLAESVPSAGGGAIEQFELTVQHLWITEVQRFITARRGVTVRVSFVDFRAFINRGHMDRWRFGILDDAGEVEPDSLLDGKTPTLAAVARYVVSRMFSEPKLIVVPDAWEEAEVPFLFDRWGSAKDAMDVILERHPAKFVAHWNGTVGLYEDGNGRIGYTVGEETDAASINGAQLPDWIQDMNGQGHVEATSYGYPSDYVIVGGPPTVATVAVDCWEPVMLLDGIPFSIREAFAELLAGDSGSIALDRAIGQTESEIAGLRGAGKGAGTASARLSALKDRRAKDRAKRLTEGAPQASDEDMAWLQRLVFRYEEFQASDRLSAEAIKIIKRDAYRLWRLPGADTFNRHLLPIRRRAETVNGIRQGIIVETYRYAMRSGTLGLSGGEVVIGATDQRNKLRAQRKNLSKLRMDINLAVSDLLKNTFALESRSKLNEKARRGLRELLDNGGLSAAEKSIATDAFRRGQSLSSIALLAEGAGANELGQAYLSELKARHATEKVLNPNSETLAHIEIYEEALALGKAIDAREAVIPGKAAEAVKRLTDNRDKRYRDKIEGRTQERGKETGFKEVFGANDPRSPDPAGKLEDADLGLVRTSLVGWLKNKIVSKAADTELVPKAVRVTFGIEMRAPKTREFPQAGYPWCDTAPEDIFPPQMTTIQLRARPQGTSVRGPGLAGLELLTAYSASFKRNQKGLERVALEDVPVGQARTEGHDDLQELIELSGSSNRAALDNQAADIAAAIVAEREALSSTVRRNYLRPWRVNNDGVVDAVEITERPGARGFTTLVVTGGGSEPFADSNKTRVRRPRDRRRPGNRVEVTRRD